MLQFFPFKCSTLPANEAKQPLCLLSYKTQYINHENILQPSTSNLVLTEETRKFVPNKPQKWVMQKCETKTFAITTWQRVKGIHPYNR
uniref:Uncharacterized protein n=1 Tax=Rhizophora mucronata TaxID=61149 RepID=A0A2P2KL56_RHIMU